MTTPLFDLLAPSARVHVVDVGASPIDGPPPYHIMHDAGICRVTGFEPRLEDRKKLQAEAKPGDLYYESLIGDGTKRPLYVTAAPGMSSTLKPSRDRLALFPPFDQWGEVRGEHVPEYWTQRLDEVSLEAPIDFLKLDIQGGELMALKGATERLTREIVFVQVEVSFVPLYLGQPTLGEIDVFMRGQGFLPHCFNGIKPWALAPARFDEGRSNQLLEADLVYVVDFNRWESLSTDQLKVLALIGHHCFSSNDLALSALDMLDKWRNKKGPVPSYARAYIGMVNAR